MPLCIGCWGPFTFTSQSQPDSREVHSAGKVNLVYPQYHRLAWLLLSSTDILAKLYRLLTLSRAHLITSPRGHWLLAAHTHTHPPALCRSSTGEFDFTPFYIPDLQQSIDPPCRFNFCKAVAVLFRIGWKPLNGSELKHV